MTLVPYIISIIVFGNLLFLWWVFIIQYAIFLYITDRLSIYETSTLSQLYHLVIIILDYLLETSLHQVFWEQVPDQIKEGIQAGHLIIFLALAQILLQLGIARVND